MSGSLPGAGSEAEHEALIQFLYLAPVGLVQAGADGGITLINPISAQLLMPLSRDGGLDNLFDALQDVAPDLRAQVRRFTAPHGMICNGEYLHLHGGRPGTPQILSLTLLKLDGARLMAVLQDVTLQVQRERQLRQSDAWLNALLASITDYALVSLDGAGRIDQWNDSIGRVTGHTAAVVGQPFSVFDPIDAGTPERVGDRLREADENGWSLDEGLRMRADGSVFWGSVLVAPLPERDPQALVSEPAYSLVLRDITDRREASETWRQAIFSDHLTGVSNRRAFFYALELELGRAQRFPRPLALVMLDLDHFKDINDTWGHAAGDAVLCAFAQALRGAFRAVDMVARLGGEEFAVLLPSTDVTQAAIVVERLRVAMAGAGTNWNGHEIACTVSAGVAGWEPQVAGMDALLHRADQAMYAAKAGGRNRIVCWAPDLPERKP